jgi:hypothetical protein
MARPLSDVFFDDVAACLARGEALLAEARSIPTPGGDVLDEVPPAKMDDNELPPDVAQKVTEKRERVAAEPPWRVNLQKMRICRAKFQKSLHHWATRRAAVLGTLSAVDDNISELVSPWISSGDGEMAAGDNSSREADPTCRSPWHLLRPVDDVHEEEFDSDSDVVFLSGPSCPPPAPRDEKVGRGERLPHEPPHTPPAPRVEGIPQMPPPPPSAPRDDKFRSEKLLPEEPKHPPPPPPPAPRDEKFWSEEWWPHEPPHPPPAPRDEKFGSEEWLPHPPPPPPACRGEPSGSEEWWEEVEFNYRPRGRRSGVKVRAQRLAGRRSGAPYPKK